MNQTSKNDFKPLTVEDLSNLHGEELKAVLAQRLKQRRDEIDEIDASLKDICEEVHKMPDIDEDKVTKEDDEALAKIEEQLDTDLNNAILDFATEDEILKDINNETDESDESNVSDEENTEPKA
jgi:uncharacterized coiled-coil DUF342 family protein